jgi:hypothetical protein
MAQNETLSGAEINQRSTVALIAPICPGASEGWRRYLQELTDSRRTDYEALCRRWGITRERAWLIETIKGAVAIMAVTTTQPEQVLERLAAGDLPFEPRLREQLLAAQGVDWTNLSTQPLVEWVFDGLEPTEPDAEGGEG